MSEASFDEMADQALHEQVLANEYPPDLDDILGADSDGTNVPIPRAAQVRARALKAQQAGHTGQTAAVSNAVRVRGGQRRILAQENRRKALELRKGGATYDQIAVAVGYKDASGARKAVQKAIQNITQEPALEVKTIQIERLNHMLLTLWGKVQVGDERAIDTSLRVMDKIDRLMGTESAQTVDVNINHQDSILIIDGNKDDYIAAMKRMVGVAGDGSNISGQQQITAHPAEGVLPDMGQNDTIDAEVVEDVFTLPPDDGKSLADHLTDEAKEAIHSVMAPPKKKFDFGVNPTVRKQ